MRVALFPPVSIESGIRYCSILLRKWHTAGEPRLIRAEAEREGLSVMPNATLTRAWRKC